MDISKSGLAGMSLAVALGLLLGFGVGRKTAPGPGLGFDPAKAMSPPEMAQAVGDTLAIADTFPRAARMAQLMQRLDAGNVEAAERVFAEQISSADRQDVRLMLAAWVAFDPRGALDHVLEWSLLSMRAYGASITVYEWALHGAALAAQQYAAGIEEKRTRRAASRGLVRGWSRSGELNGLTQHLAGLEQGDFRDELIEAAIAGIMASQGIDGVIRWAEAISDDAKQHFKRLAFRKAIRQVTVRNPMRGARWYEASAEHEFAERALPAVATEWVEHDPVAALSWLRARPNGGEKDLALTRAMNRWMRTDRRGARKWLSAHSELLENELRPMLVPYVTGLAGFAPEQAARWVDRIGDERDRIRAVREIAATWLVTDPVKARAWLTQVKVPDAVRSEIANRRPRRRAVEAARKRAEMEAADRSGE